MGICLGNLEQKFIIILLEENIRVVRRKKKLHAYNYFLALHQLRVKEIFESSVQYIFPSCSLIGSYKTFFHISLLIL